MQPKERQITGSGGRIRRQIRIKDLPEHERPRERLIAHGPRRLTDVELVAVLLGTGDRRSGASAIDLAMRVIDFVGHRGGGLRELADLSSEELRQLPGIGPAKAARLTAAAELGRRAASAGPPGRAKIRGPEDVAGLVAGEMEFLRREHFRIVLVNTRNHVLGTKTVSIGSLDQAPVHPREVFRPAIERNAAAVVLVHNHPSGDPTPSPEDLAVTRRLIQAGKLMGIKVLDHIIIGHRQHVSVRERHPGWFDQS